MRIIFSLLLVNVNNFRIMDFENLDQEKSNALEENYAFISGCLIHTT